MVCTQCENVTAKHREYRSHSLSTADRLPGHISFCIQVTASLFIALLFWVSVCLRVLWSFSYSCWWDTTVWKVHSILKNTKRQRKAWFLVILCLCGFPLPLFCHHVSGMLLSGFPQTYSSCLLTCFFLLDCSLSCCLYFSFACLISFTCFLDHFLVCLLLLCFSVFLPGSTFQPQKLTKSTSIPTVN